MDGIAYCSALILTLMTIFIWNFLTGKKKAAAEISDEGDEDTEYPDHSVLSTKAPAISISSYRPLWKGLAFGGAVFVVVMIGVTLFQFFLQFALAPEYSNTWEFWIQGILIGLGWGAALGILPAVLIGFLVWSKAAPIKTQLQQKNGLVTQEKNWSIRDDVSSKKQNAEGATAESARHKRNIIGFALILFVPTVLCIGFMFIGVWLMQ